MSGLFKEDLTDKPVERVHLNLRELMERSYRLDPSRTHAELVQTGYWTVASQLKVDYESGRLSE